MAGAPTTRPLSLIDLPNEVLDSCFQDLSKLTLARLRLTHCRLEQSAARLLFERIDVPPLPNEALFLFYKLRNSPHLAPYVKTVRCFRAFGCTPHDEPFSSMYVPTALALDGSITESLKSHFPYWRELYKTQGQILSDIFEGVEPDPIIVDLRELPPLPNVRNIEIGGILDTYFAPWLDFIPMYMRTTKPSSRFARPAFDDHSLQGTIEKVLTLISSEDNSVHKIENIEIADFYQPWSLQRFRAITPRRQVKYRDYDLLRQPLKPLDSPYPLSAHLKRASFIISPSTAQDDLFQKMLVHTAGSLEELSIGVAQYVDPGPFFQWFHQNPSDSPLRIRSFFLTGVPPPSKFAPTGWMLDRTLSRYADGSVLDDAPYPYIEPFIGVAGSALKNLGRFLDVHGQFMDELVVGDVYLFPLFRSIETTEGCYTEFEDWLTQLRGMNLVRATLYDIPELKRWGSLGQNLMLDANIHAYIGNAHPDQMNPLDGLRRWEFPFTYPSVFDAYIGASVDIRSEGRLVARHRLE